MGEKWQHGTVFSPVLIRSYTATVKLLSLPRHSDPSAYEETRQMIIERHRGIKGLTALVEFGTIPFPGISDMDMYAIVEPHTRVNLPSMSSYTDEQRYIMMHKHFAVSANVFSDLHYCDPWLLHADPILGDTNTFRMPQCPFGEEERIMLSYHFITVNGLVSFLPMLREALCDDTLHVREYLESIKYVEYHERELKRAGDLRENDTDPSLSLYKELRAGWFTIPEQERASRVSETLDAYKISMKRLITVTNEALKKRSTEYAPPESAYPPLSMSLLEAYPRSVVVETGTAAYVYQEGRTDCELRHYDVSVPPKGARVFTVVVLPLFLSAVQNDHLFSEGKISEQYRRCFVTDLPSVPVIRHPALVTLRNVMKKNVEETQQVMNAKQPFDTYGLGTSAKKRTMRASLGRAYDAWQDAAVRRQKLGTPTSSVTL